MKVEEPPVASQQDGTYPRPQLIRSQWIELGGEWDFGFGDDPVEAASSVLFDRVITVPYPPESSASGIGDTGFHHVVWYRRSFGVAEIRGAGYWDDDSRILLHFGAVDWAADVWVNEIHVGHHDGGQSPFSFDGAGSPFDQGGIARRNARPPLGPAHRHHDEHR
jgi:beta-galactosidase/beta-glucuronidase